MFTKRTDLALEAREIWTESAQLQTQSAQNQGKSGQNQTQSAQLQLKSAQRQSEPDGVRTRKKRIEGCSVTRVEILDERGVQALGKPVGHYVTVDVSGFQKHRGEYFARAVRAVGQELKSFLPERGSALVIGLGNAAMTPDAVGPLAVQNVLVTRHLSAEFGNNSGSSDNHGKNGIFGNSAKTDLCGISGGLRPVAAFCPGVTGLTGIESAETVFALAERIHPAMIIAVDALASRRRERLCSTIQLSDTGILPGSGVGNHRTALNQETLGIPVAAAGVPTVIDALTLAADLLEESGQQFDEHSPFREHSGFDEHSPRRERGGFDAEAFRREHSGFDEYSPHREHSGFDEYSPCRERGGFDAEAFRREHIGLMVTPQDIDAQVRDLSKIIGYGINWALQDLDIADIDALLS